MFSCSVVVGRLQLLQCNAINAMQQACLQGSAAQGRAVHSPTKQNRRQLPHITTFRLCSVELNQSQVVIAIIESGLCVSVVVRDLID